MEYITEYSSDSVEDQCHSCPEASFRHSEDSKDVHQGRIRSFPHVEGQYATHVFIQVAVPGAGISVQNAYEAFQAHLATHVNGMHRITDSTSNHDDEDARACLHVSLSRTVPITLAQIESLLKELKIAFRRKKRPLTLQIGGSAKVLVNDDGTRTFVVLPVTDSGVLEDMIDAVSRVFVRHGLPKYYDCPDIHTSIAWCLGNSVTESLNKAIKSSSNTLERLTWTTHVTQVLCRIGKKDHCVWQAGV